MRSSPVLMMLRGIARFKSKNAFKLAIAVERTDAIACSPAVSAAPANHLALCSGGRRLKSICS